MGDAIQIAITMLVYMLAVIGIGLAFARRANASSDDYFLGGRDAGPLGHRHERRGVGHVRLAADGPARAWPTGAALADAAWTAIGLAVGTYINWLIVSKRLRRYSEKAGNAITLPEFFSNRFHEKKQGGHDHRRPFHPDVLHGLCRQLPGHLRQAFFHPVWI